jgi:3-oxoacyl-(acyl-carrier-protein) synthase
VDEIERDLAQDLWWSFWAERSSSLREYLDELRDIESLAVEGDVELGKLAAMKEKRRRLRKLQQKWGAPDPPWQAVSANFIWNIDNIGAAQISMLGRLTGMTVSVGAACSTFGVTLKMAIDAIQRGEAKAVVIGATDPPPSPLTVGAFYAARVISADAQISKPLTELRGTHIAGGSVVWIVGDYEHMTAQGFTPLGLEPVAVAVTSDADHIITPSKEGPTEAMSMALRKAAGDEQVASWDLHATATPGDFNEVEMVRELLPEDVLVTARKGTFGHGMSAGGGWELTAQYLGYQRGRLFPTPLTREELNQQIAGVHDRFVFDSSCEAPRGLVGKMSMGVGGINACVISRPLPTTGGSPGEEND